MKIKQLTFSVLICFLFLTSTSFLYAQNKHKVYREICGKSNTFNDFLSLNLVGDGEINLTKLLNGNGEKLELKSMPDVMNYLSKYGWKLESTSTTLYDSSYILFYWVISKDIDNNSEIMDGIYTKQSKRK